MTKAKVNITVQPRDISGKRVHRLRTAGDLPANIYGQGESTQIQLKTKDFTKLYATMGDTGLAYMTVEGQKNDRPVMVDEVQVSGISGALLHVSFREVSLKEKISAEVPVEVVGEIDVAEGVLVVVRDSVEIEALPTDIPEKFEIDVSILTEVGQSISFRDLKYDKNTVSLTIDEEMMDSPLIQIEAQREEEPEEVEEPAQGEDGESAQGTGSAEDKSEDQSSDSEKSE